MLTNQSRPGQFRLIILLLVTVVGCAAPARAKSKDDVVVLKNGDRLTGEIKKLQRGEFVFKASYMADAVRLDFNTFRFTTTNISSRLLLYPSLTTPGRTRVQFNTDLRIKLVKDLYWGLHLYENYDSKPPVRAEKSELGVSASLGWKF